MLPIPLINLQQIVNSNHKLSESDFRELGKVLLEALGQWGFIYLENHGIPEEKITKAFSTSKDFFNLTKYAKLKYGRTGASIHGYYESLDHYEKKYTCREIFDVFDTSSNGKYPKDQVPEFKDSLLNLKDELNKLGILILRLIAAGLDLDDMDYFVKVHNGLKYESEEKLTNANCSQTNLRTMYYPVLSQSAQELIRSVGKNELLNEHTDYGTITILLQDNLVGGLEVLQGKNWVPIPPRKGTVILNTGDLLEIWTGGLIPATIHRVVSISSIPRQSIPYFINPDNEVIVEPICQTENPNGKIYPRVVAKEYSQNRIGYLNKGEANAMQNQRY